MASIDQFNAHARAGNPGQRRLHLGVIGLVIGGADRRTRISDGFRELADVAGREDQLRAPALTSALMPASA